MKRDDETQTEYTMRVMKAEWQAEALREAADAFQKAWPVYGDDWLRERADRIAAGGAL